MRKSLTYAIISILFWSTSASAFKITLKFIDFFSLLFYSSFFSVLILFLLNLKLGNLKKILNFSSNRNSIYLGFLVPFLYYMLLFLGYSIMKGQEMLILNNTWQIFFFIFSVIFFFKTIKLFQVLGILISFIGILILATKGNVINFKFSNPFGFLLGISCAIIWAIYWILNANDERKIEIKLFYNFLFGFFYISFFMIFFGSLKFNIYGIIGSFYISIFEMSITFLIYAKAIEEKIYIPIVANLMYLTPIISIFLLSIIVGEKIEIWAIISIIIIIFGIILTKLQ
ncbi:MAG: DMT family transporter [candidate division WOR-3 bacterium]